MNTVRKSDIAEQAVSLDLLKRDFQVALPFSTSCDWDLLLVRPGETFCVERIQVKYAEAKKGVIPVRARTHSNTSAKQTSRAYTSADIDWMGVYCPDVNQCYYVPASVLDDGKEILHLRLYPSQNNQVQGIRWAHEYRTI